MPAFLRKREVFLLDCWALCRESWWRCPRPIADPQTIAAPSSPGRTGNCSRRALVQIIDGGSSCVYSQSRSSPRTQKVKPVAVHSHAGRSLARTVRIRPRDAHHRRSGRAPLGRDHGRAPVVIAPIFVTNFYKTRPSLILILLRHCPCRVRRWRK
jgi:hypothetical protein